MEATHANLSRLNDVIQEIERNLGSLERQAQKARQYKKYKDELLDKEMTWGRRKTQVIRQTPRSARASRRTLSSRSSLGLRAELQTAENYDRNRSRRAAHRHQGRRRTAGPGSSTLSDELTREQSALELSRRRQGDLHRQLEALENEKSELRASIDEEAHEAPTDAEASRR